MARNIRIGAFVALGLAAMIFVALFLGRSRAIFSKKVTLHAELSNVSGLIVGSPVRLAGIDAGQVSSIRFTDNPGGRGTVTVNLTIDRRWLSRIRADSVAELASMGLLGDMLVNISLGSPDQPELRDGDRIEARAPESISSMMTSAGRVLAQLESITKNASQRFDETLTPELAENLNRIAAAAADVSEAMTKGNGLAHALLYDPALARSTTSLLASASGTAMRLDRAAGRVESMLHALETEDGLLHAAIYGEGGTETLAELGRTARELSKMLAEVREGDGALHTLVYGGGEQNIAQNLADATDSLRRIADDLQAGKGTIGGLLKDPRVYQDLVASLGRVRRNALLKALIRSTVERDGLERPEVDPRTATNDRG